MRKVVFGGACSLDGYFARDDGGVDWLRWSDDVQEIMVEMWPRFDVMVMGRKTWEHAQAQFSEEDLEKAASLKSAPTTPSSEADATPPQAGGELKTYVFSRTLPGGVQKGGYEIVNEDAGEFVRRLKYQDDVGENHPVGEAPPPLIRMEGSPDERAENHHLGEAPPPLLRKEGSSGGKDIMVMGGGELGSALLDAGVVDEIGFNIQPVVLGSGIPVWNRISRQIDLELTECRALTHGCVYVTYKVVNSR